MKRTLPALALAASMTLAWSAPALAAEGQPEIKSISAGNYHVFAVDTAGGLWAWGWNQDGQLGDPGLDNSGGDAEGPFQTRPAKVMEGVTSARAGSGLSTVYKADGSIWLLGEMMEAPKAFSEAPPTSGSALVVDAGGVLWMWGSNAMGQLAPGGAPEERAGAPVKLMDSVAAAEDDFGHVMALKTDGTLWSWGDNSFGKTGAGSPEPELREPVQVLDRVERMALGTNDSFAVREDGTLWGWGLAEGGLLSGRGSGMDGYGQTYQSAPVQLMEGVAAMASGHGTQYILKTDGTLWACGGSSFGELGSGTVADERTAQPVQILTDVVQVTAGDCFAAALKTDGTVWSWGINGNGQLGNGGKGDGASIIGPTQSVPVRVSFAPTEDGLTAYPGVSFAIMVDGRWEHLSLYGLEDEKGDRSYYVRLRDVAACMSETQASFGLEYDADTGTIRLLTGERYLSQTGDGDLPFAGEQDAQRGGSSVTVDGVPVELDSITLTDSAGGGHTYFKLRDLGRTLGFDVRWDSTYRHEFLDVSGRILIETDKPYTED